jgi:hypothetical protein
MSCMNVSPRSKAFESTNRLPKLAGQTCGYSLGNSSSRALSGKRSETGPFGVEEASNPNSVTSVRTRRAVRSGWPVVGSPPLSNSPRMSASRSSLRFQSATPLKKCPKPLLQLIQLEQSRHELNLIQADSKEPQHKHLQRFQREVSSSVQVPCRGISAKSIMRLYSPRLQARVQGHARLTIDHALRCRFDRPSHGSSSGSLDHFHREMMNVIQTVMGAGMAMMRLP